MGLFKNIIKRTQGSRQSCSITIFEKSFPDQLSPKGLNWPYSKKTNGGINLILVNATVEVIFRFTFFLANWLLAPALRVPDYMEEVISVCSGWGSGPWPFTARTLGWVEIQDPSWLCLRAAQKLVKGMACGCSHEENWGGSKCGDIKFPLSSHCCCREAWHQGWSREIKEQGLCRLQSYTLGTCYPNSFRLVRYSGQASIFNIALGYGGMIPCKALWLPDLNRILMVFVSIFQFC